MLPTLSDLVPDSVGPIGMRDLLLGVAIWLVGLLWSLVPSWDANIDEPPYVPYSIPCTCFRLQPRGLTRAP